MKFHSHLLLEETAVPASEEWRVPTAEWFFLRTTQGQGYWLVGNEAKAINQGDLVVVPPECQGIFRASLIGAVRLVYFHFCPSTLGGLLTVTERHCLESIAARPPVVARIMPAKHPLAIQFTALCKQAETRNGLFLRSLMLQLVGNFFARDLDRVSHNERPIFSANKRIKVLMQNLTEADFLDMSVEQLAAYCGCSLRHFGRLFRKDFGVSLRERQTELRLQKARQLLNESDSSISAVAAACGYRQVGAFNVVFRRRFGTTPTEWRRQRREVNGDDGGAGAAGVVTEK